MSFKYKSIELFAGAGGLALGLEMAGFEHIGLVEFDKYAAKTLKINRPEWNVLCEDIETVSSRNLEKEFGIKKYELDLISGGAPCQSFSYAGKRLGLEDTRGTMFYHYATFLNKLQPKVFLFENVKGLLTHDKGKTFKTIHNIFMEQGYTIKYSVLNAIDYGVAQKRERLIVIGVRNDLVGTLNFEFPKKYDYRLVLRDILLDVPQSECASYSKSKKEIFKLVPPGGYWRDINPDIAKEYMKGCWFMGGGRTGILRRLSLDEPSLTVLTAPQMKQTERCHPVEIRPFSIRENARIQSFPDGWKFVGTIASQYKQIGNAVPCNLAKEIGLKIQEALMGRILDNRSELNSILPEDMPYNTTKENTGGMVMNNYYNLSFISQIDFEKHVTDTLKQYNETLKAINLKKFNSNLIDPIKLLFDKSVFDKSFEEIIKLEVHRQRDKSNSNIIGYFHQNMFKYINNCVVPNEGWDIIFTSDKNTYYIEMKNKHNTMNSSSSAKTFIRMQNHLLNGDNSETSICALVEVIAKRSQNDPWKITLDKEKQRTNERLRRISIDKFYEIVTGDRNAFKDICKQLPITIEKITINNKSLQVERDTVFDELECIDKNTLLALYKLAFSTYEGFDF